ncbi:unnamed protein product [Prunus armeniaca]
MALEAAVEAAADLLDKAVKTVMVGGPKTPSCTSRLMLVAMLWLVHECTTFCYEIVESADAYLFAGSVFNDYSSVGYSALLKKEKAVIVQPDSVTIENGPAFGCVVMKDFLKALSKRLKWNKTAYEMCSYRAFED